MLEVYLAAARTADRAPRDKARVVLAGAFCEQPPLGLLTTLERAGCYVVDDDTLLGPRFLVQDVLPPGGPQGDPLDALVTALLEHRAASAFLFCEDNDKGQELIETVQRRKADGVVFCAPSFCDPALLDRPMLTRALDQAGISHTSFKYAENTGQFQGIREQAGTFADSLKLWGEA
jgi:benzoyl-CoA reductase subunit C